MRFIELKNIMTVVFKQYQEQIKTYTSAQLSSFQKEFCAKHNTAVKGNMLCTAKPVMIEDTVTVSDVREAIIVCKGFFSDRKKCYEVVCNFTSGIYGANFVFSVKKSNREVTQLRKGQKINVVGYVHAAASRDVDRYDKVFILISEANPFSFTIIK